MQTAVISYRVADFLKQHPPFQYMDEADLVGLAGRGRVKFHESDEYIVWQGAAHSANVLVIQQGTVSIWEERAGADAPAEKDGAKNTERTDTLRDIRGIGDLLGVERFAGAEKALYSAKSTSDVVVYAFPAAEFAALVAKYPAAGEYLAASASAGTEYQPSEQRKAADAVFLYDVIRGKSPEVCQTSSNIREAVGKMRAAGRAAIAVLDEQKQLAGVLTADRVLRWVEEGGSDSSGQVLDLLADPTHQVSKVCTLPLDSPISECVLSMASANMNAAAITEHGANGGRFHGLVTSDDLAPVFGEHPSVLLAEIRSAPGFEALRELNQRLRAFLLENLQSPASVDWLARFAHLADTNIFERVLQLTGPHTDKRAESACWCFAGAAGRRESLTLAAPSVILLTESNPEDFVGWHQAAQEGLEHCGYVFPAPAPIGAQENESGSSVPFACSSVEEWEARFAGWLNDPVLNHVFLARPMFDLLPVSGNRNLYDALASHISGNVTQGFLYLLANDCLSNLPPLTFFRDAVVQGSGEQSDVFNLEHTALDPLVDVGRVFGIAAGQVLSGSIATNATMERFALAKALLPEEQAIFREASETLRTVLYQQARVGIRQRTDGSKLPPALLSRHDRQILRNGFRSILKLLEFTAGCQWLERL